MATTPERLKDLFGEAMERAGAERSAFLATACGDDHDLRQLLEELLHAHESAGAFLDHPAELVAAAAAEAAAAAHDDGLRPGQRIGNHELVAPLGRGGFGSVWRARQLRPVERDVALKILQLDGDGGRVTARFLAERQTLARMQHPGIAKVFDAGTTDDGRPWLSMELVDGEPITTWCAGRRLDLRARLALFAEVCLAVQHAHQKGVVHRDLKPSNVLVTQRDGVPQPVVIDFGVAMVLADRDAGDDVQLLGTPDYMSPEQAASDPQAIDARTDVYSLGVLLYELVTGLRPHVRPTGAVGPQELLRRIREDDPLPPSHAGGARLPREIDWLAARALAKDPERRYPTVAALADDVRRLLAHEPLAAGPLGAGYRLRKFVRRHRLGVATAVTVLASLGVGTFVAAHGWLEAERAASRANRALDLLDEMWGDVDPSRLARADYPVRELLLDFERALPLRVQDEPSVELRVRRTLARLQNFVGAFESAEVHATRAVALADAVADPAQRLEALLQRSRARFDRGDVDGAEADAQAAAALAAAGADPAGRALGMALEMQGNCLMRRGDRDEALRVAERALAVRERGGAPTVIARSRMQLANLHGSVGRADAALAQVELALASLAPLGPDHPDALIALHQLAFLQQRRGDVRAAEAGFRDSITRRQRVYGDEHPQVAWAKVDLAWLLHEQQRDRDAEPLLREALPVLRQRLGERHLYVSETQQRLGAVLVGLRRAEEAEPLLREAVQRYRTLPGHPPDGLVGCLGNLASLQWGRGDRAAAKATQEEALAIARERLPADHFVLSVGMTNLAWMEVELGGIERAVELLRDALARSSGAGRVREATLQRQRLVALLRQLGRDAEADEVKAGGN